MSADEQAHRFDRRKTDPNVASLAVRVASLEKGFESLDHRVTEYGRSLERQSNEISANTALTEEAHGQTATLLERVDDLAPKIDRLYKVAEATDNLVRVAGWCADRVVDASDLVEKRPKTLLALSVAAIAIYSTARAGQLPGWVEKVVKLILA